MLRADYVSKLFLINIERTDVSSATKAAGPGGGCMPYRENAYTSKPTGLFLKFGQLDSQSGRLELCMIHQS